MPQGQAKFQLVLSFPSAPKSINHEMQICRKWGFISSAAQSTPLGVCWCLFFFFFNVKLHVFELLVVNVVRYVWRRSVSEGETSALPIILESLWDFCNCY